MAGDLMRDGKDLYAAMQEIIAHLPRKVRITDIDLVGYSLGGANAAIVKSIDATEHKLKIHRVVMINPPVSLFSSVGRLDRLFAATIGPGEQGSGAALSPPICANRKSVSSFGPPRTG